MGGVPLPRNPAVGVRAPVPPGHATPPPLHRLTYVGVYRDPSKGWMARVMDLKRRATRSIGPFDDLHQAALAHDRVAVACAGRGIITAKQLNFGSSFYASRRRSCSGGRATCATPSRPASTRRSTPGS
ncbi:hypothetical protein ACQ4PT_024581 [Festuca glaucescens]